MTHLGERPGYGQGALPFSPIPPPCGSALWDTDLSGRKSWRYSPECVEGEFSEVRLACMGIRRLCGKSIMGSGQRFGPLGWPASAQKREKGVCIVSDAHKTNHESRACCGPGYASPAEAMKAEREKVLYTVALYVGTEVEQPDYLATVDVDPESPTYSRVVERLPMPNVGDELHHFGWNACSSCHDNESKSRRFLVVPGERTGRINIIDTQDERAPKMHKVIEPEEIIEKTNLSAPHRALSAGQNHDLNGRRRRGQRPRRLSLARRGFQRSRSLGEEHARHALQLRLLVPAAPQRHGLQRVGRPQYLPRRLRSQGGGRGQVR